MAFEEVKTDVHNFDDGPIEGIYVRAEDSQFEGNNFVLDVNGKEVLIFGKTALQTKMSRVKPGEKIRITSLGEKKSEKSGRTYVDFKVEVDK